MRIGIDARMYGIAQRGIGRYVQELVNELIVCHSGESRNPGTYLIPTFVGTASGSRVKHGMTENLTFVLFLSQKGMDMVPDHPRVSKILAPWHWYSIAEQLHIPCLIKKAKVDIMHFTHFNVPWFCPVPYVVTLHDLILLHTNRARATTLGPLLYSIKYAAWKLLLRHTLNKAQYIIVPSRAVKSELAQWMPRVAPKTSVVHEGTPSPCPLPRGERVWGEGEIPSPYILYVGSAYPHKNLERLVQAFQIFRSETSKFGSLTSKCSLILVGKHDYFYERLKQEYPLPSTSSGQALTKKGIKGEVMFTGEVSDERLSELYRNAALVVCPALHEGFGLPALEAAAHGAPLAVSDIPVFREILGSETSKFGSLTSKDAPAFFFNPYDIRDIAHVLQEALTNEGARHAHIKNAQERAQAFSWKKMAQETLAVYRNITHRSEVVH